MAVCLVWSERPGPLKSDQTLTEGLQEYGFYRPDITEVVNDYLKCGDLKEGSKSRKLAYLARVRCPDCHHEFLLAFSCRGRWFRSLVPRLPVHRVTPGKRGTRLRTFGDYAKWHPHIHSITADGLFRESGVFHVMPRTDLTPLAELFRAEVLKMLKKEGLIDDQFITMIMKWRHTSGFSVDNGVRIARDDQKGQTAVAQISEQSETSVYTQKPVFRI